MVNQPGPVRSNQVKAMDSMGTHEQPWVAKSSQVITSQLGLTISWPVIKACAFMVSQPGPARSNQVKPWAAMGGQVLSGEARSNQVKPWAAMGSHGQPATSEQTWLASKIEPGPYPAWMVYAARYTQLKLGNSSQDQTAPVTSKASFNYHVRSWLYLHAYPI